MAYYNICHKNDKSTEKVLEKGAQAKIAVLLTTWEVTHATITHLKQLPR
jgi:hypothetical protein